MYDDELSVLDSLIRSLVYLFSELLLSPYSVPGPELGTGDQGMKLRF